MTSPRFRRYKKEWDRLNLKLDCAKAALATARHHATNGNDQDAAYHLRQFRFDLRGAMRIATGKLGVKPWTLK